MCSKCESKRKYFVKDEKMCLTYLIINGPLSSNSWRSVLNIFNKLIMNFVKYVFNRCFCGVTVLASSYRVEPCFLGGPAEEAEISAKTSKSSRTTWKNNKKQKSNKDFTIILILYCILFFSKITRHHF